MNASEASKLLTIVGLVDNRVVMPEKAKLWAQLMPDISLTDAVAAVRLHFRTSTDYLMPNHIIVCARRIDEYRKHGGRVDRSYSSYGAEPVVRPDADVAIAIAQAQAELSA